MRTGRIFTWGRGGDCDGLSLLCTMRKSESLYDITVRFQFCNTLSSCSALFFEVSGIAGLIEIILSFITI